MPEHPSTEPDLENNRIYKMKTTYHYKMPKHPLHRFHHMDFKNLGNTSSIKWYPVGHFIVPKHPHFIEGAFTGDAHNKLISSWWLNQPLWKIWSSNWIIFQFFVVRTPKIFETTGLVERTVLLWNHRSLDSLDILRRQPRCKPLRLRSPSACDTGRCCSFHCRCLPWLKWPAANQAQPQKTFFFLFDENDRKTVPTATSSMI